jgi:tetratricopeptide (TPR) repeat protein
MIFGLGDSDKAIERARKLYSEGKIDRAIVTLERSLSGGKDDFPLLLEIGRYFIETSKYVEAASNLKRAFHLSPEHWERVVETIETGHYSSGTPIETGSLLIEIYIEKDMFDDARKVIDASSPDQIEEMYSRYETIYNNVISKKEPESYTSRDISYLYALALLRQKQNLKAGLEMYEMLYITFPREREKIQKDLDELIRMNYGNPHPLFLAGKFLIIEQKYEQALKQFDRTCDLDATYVPEVMSIVEEIASKDKNPLLLLFAAKYALVQDDTKKARAYAREMENIKGIPGTEITKIYNEIIRRDKLNSDVRLSLVKVYARDGKFDSVLSELAGIIESNPEKFDEVTRIAEEIIEKDPYNANLLYFLAELYVEKGNSEKGIETFERLFAASKELSGEIIDKLNKILERDIENTRALNLLANVYAYKKRFEEALFIYEHLMGTTEGFEMAEKGIQEIVQQYPELLQAKIALGLAAFKRGAHKESLDIITSVVEDDPSKVAKLIPQLDSIARGSVKLAPYVLQVYDAIPEEAIDPSILCFAKAEAYALAEDYGNALDSYMKSLQANPDLTEKVIAGMERTLESRDDLAAFHFELGKICLQTNRAQEGMQHIRKANELDPKLSDEVIQILYGLTDKLPKSSTAEVALLRALLNKGAYEQVISECEDAIERYPKEETGSIYLLHGHASLEKGLLKQASLSIVHALDIDESLAEEALNLLSKAQEIDKKNVVVKYGLAKASIAARRYSAAAHYFYDITKYDPSKINKAVEELKKIAKLDRVNPDVHFALGSLYLTEKRLKDSIEEFRAASELSTAYTDKVIGKLHYIEKHNPVPEVHLNLGQLYVQKRMYSKATHHLMEAYKKDPKLIDQAALYFTKIHEQDPQNTAVLYAVADLAERENDIFSAIASYDKILSSVPEDLPKIRQKVEKLLEEYKEEPETMLFLAKIFAMEGKSDESITTLRKILEIYPDKIQAVMERMREMAEKGDDAATFALVEYSLLHHQLETIVLQLKKLEPNFAFHERLADLLKAHVSQYPDHPGLVLYLAKFLFLKDDREGLREVLSRGLSSLEQKASAPLLMFKYLHPETDDEESRVIKAALIEKMGRKKFYGVIKQLEEEKKGFLLNRVRFARNKSADAPALLFEEAELLIELGKSDEAIALVSVSFKKTSDRYIAQFLSAKSFFKKGNPVRAIEILRSTRLPKDKELRNKSLLLLSAAYEKIGDFQSALITLGNCAPDANIERRIAYLNDMFVNTKIKGGNPIISG